MKLLFLKYDLTKQTKKHWASYRLIMGILIYIYIIGGKKAWFTVTLYNEALGYIHC